MTGKIISENNIDFNTENKSYMYHNLKSGIYIVNINSGSENYNQKIRIQ